MSSMFFEEMFYPFVSLGDKKGLKEVDTRYGKSNVMEDGKLVGDGGEIDFHIWDSLLKQLHFYKPYFKEISWEDPP